MRQAPPKSKPTQPESKQKQKRMVEDETIASEIKYVLERMDGNTPPLPVPADEDSDDEDNINDDDSQRGHPKPRKVPRPTQAKATGGNPPKDVAAVVDSKDETKRVLPGASVSFVMDERS